MNKVLTLHVSVHNIRTFHAKILLDPSYLTINSDTSVYLVSCQFLPSGNFPIVDLLATHTPDI